MWVVDSIRNVNNLPKLSLTLNSESEQSKFVNRVVQGLRKLLEKLFGNDVRMLSADIRLRVEQ